MKKLLLVCLLMSACSSVDLTLQTYGHPSSFTSAKQWMSQYYIEAIRFDGEPIGYRVGGELFSSYAKAQQWMVNIYSEDYEQFFKHCFDMHQLGETCEFYK